MEPRPYQKAAVDAIKEALKTHPKVGAVLPTGSGKSLCQTMLIDDEVERLSFNQCVLVVCHLTDIVDQLNLFYSEHGKHGRKAMRFSARNKPRVGHKVVFATVQSLVSSSARHYWTEDPMRKEVAAVIIDEAHQFGTDSYETLANDLFPLSRYIGFSATPYRKNQFSFAQFDHVAYAIDAETLIRDGYLTPPRLFQLNMENMSSSERYASIVKIWRERERERGLVSVVYLRSKAEAQEMRLLAEEEGIKVDFVSGETSESYCRAVYANARNGHLEMLVNVRKLEMGIDIPNIGAVFMPFGTNSVVTYLQRIGRALRPWRGKSEAHVYVFGDAPSIQRGKWQKIQREALSSRDPLDPLRNLEDDLEELIEENAPEARIAWTREAIAACELLLSGNMRSVAELIAERKFPDKYAKALAKLAPMMKPSNPGAEPKPISDAQISILTKRHRFEEKDVRRLNEGEAGAILQALEAFFTRSPYILQSGPFAGTHVADTPPMYRRHIKDNANRALWQRWRLDGKPKGERGET